MTPIAIAGMHRTGTSMIAKALRLGGLHLGEDSDFLPPAPDNPGGFFEHAGFVQLDDDLLEAVGAAWDHLPACPPQAADDPRVEHLRGPAMRLVEELGVVPTWGWKDPRTSLTVRFWLDLLPDLRVVVCVRNPLEVALSLKRRNRSSYARGLSLWHGYYDALLEAVPEDRRIVTHYDAHFRDPAAEAARLVTFVDLPRSRVTDAEAARDPEQRHHRLDVTLAEAGVSPETIELYARLCAEADYSVAPTHLGKPSESSHVDRRGLDLVFAKEQLERRARQVASLERQRGELSDRVTELEAAGRGATVSGIEARLDGLEEAIQDVRYGAESRPGGKAGALVQGCRALVRAHVPRSEEVLVVTGGDAALLDLYGRPATDFGQHDSDHPSELPFDHGVAAIARLEAGRLSGSRFLLIPELAASWRERLPELGAHLAGRYELVADEPGAGSLIDLGARHRPKEGWPRGLSEVIDCLAAMGGGEPAVLDWTGLALAGQLAERKVFAPPPGDALPYLDDTIEVVLVTDAAMPSPEAKRVATLAVVTVETGATVTTVELVSPEVAGEREPLVRFVVDADDADPVWLSQLEEALATERSAEIVASPGWPDRVGDDEVIALLDEGVLPLPGCCDAVRSTLAGSERVGAVTAKLLAADGSMEAAGAVVFADGSWAGIAAGSQRVVAPWHEYVRESCGAPGLLFLAAEAVDKLGSGELASLERSSVGGAAALWAAGLRIVYQPDAAAVRASGAPETGAATMAAAWGPALKARPPRPEVLDESAWRELLARDDVQAAWR